MAGHPHAIERQLGRDDLRTDRHRGEAARREAAAGWRIAQVGREAGDDLERPAVGRDVREGRQEPLRVGVPRPPEHLADGALLRHPTGVHDQHLVARLGDDRQVVGDEDQRQPELGAQLLEEAEDLRLDHDVEGGRRLVADDDRRVARERHRDHRPLAHPTGQLVRIGAAALLRDADKLEELVGPCERRLARLAEALLDGLGDLLTDPFDGVEGIHRTLEDDADLAPAVATHRFVGLAA